MIRMKSSLSIALIICFALSRSAHANPVILMPGTSPQEIIALCGETLVIALLLARRKFDFIRVLYTWFFITLVTYWVFIYGLIGVTLGLENIKADTATVGVIWVLATEAAIIWIEAKIILGLSKSRFYRDPEEPFLMPSALLVSLIGNVSSIIIGVVQFMK